MAPALVGLVQGSISAATYAATEKIAYGRNPSITDTLIVGVTSGVMAGGMQFVGQKLGMIQCLIAGTLVATKSGLVPIEDIQPGDLVWATDEETGETALKEVVQTFRNETEEWVHVKVNGEEITCTPMHQFYSPVKGWTSAIDLRAGDILVMLNGEYVVVEQVQHELIESPEITYNFEVEDFHTYYVGDEPVLVHNKCSGSYEIFTDSDQVYVGKGSIRRMNQSIRRLEHQGYTVTSSKWTSSLNNKTAFVDEYMKMAKYNFDFGGKLINKIMSPGFKIFNSWL